MPTGITAVAGACFILGDPIFNGPPIPLSFGILVSAVAPLVVITLLHSSLRPIRSARST